MMDLQDELCKKITMGDNLIVSLDCVSHVRGVQKLQRKVTQELAFLKKVLNQKCVKPVHVKCSNLSHLEAHVKYVLNNRDYCTSIFETFEIRLAEGSIRRLCVDVVKDDGCTWVKVVARNARALTLSSSGDGEYGQRSIIDQAKEFLKCADQHPHNFETPKIVFDFAGGIEVPLAHALEKMNIVVHGERITNFDYMNQNSDESDFENDCWDIPVSLEAGVAQMHMEEEETPSEQGTSENNTYSNYSSRLEDRLNLDVTAMIAYVSALTNGGSHSQFKEYLLNQQAQWERERPAKAILDDLFKGKMLYCCKAAHDDFCKIIHTLGGPLEKRRAEILLGRVTVVPNQLSERTKLNLKEVGKIKSRSRIIFGTGDHLKAKTVTANQGFVRAAKSQGLSYSVVYHESRALTERKVIPVENKMAID